MLTFCTHQRLPRFGNAEIVNVALSQILRAADDEQFAILAYCFMPDHLHLLVAGTAETSDAKRFIARAKQLSGYACRRYARGRLWQRSAWDRVMNANDDVRGIIRYFLANPVRAGLAEHPLDYPFLGSATFDREALMDFYR